MEIIRSVCDLENSISKLEQVECKVLNTFSNGLYVRQIEIPKGTLLVGKRHRESTLNMLTKGSMTIIDGDERFYIEAPYTFTADKFSKKAGYAHEDSIWVNIHITDSTNLYEIESKFIITEEEFNMIEHKDIQCLG